MNKILVVAISNENIAISDMVNFIILKFFKIFLRNINIHYFELTIKTEKAVRRK